MRNGLVEVEVANDGTLRVGTLTGIGQLVDGGDFGDSYNYGPPLHDTLVGEPESVTVEVIAVGPVHAAFSIVRTYRWPIGVLQNGTARTPETALVPVTTQVALRAGERFVRLEIRLENPCYDHRLGFHVPLGQTAEVSWAEGQFGVVERGPAPEEGHGEVPLATYPARGFVAAGGVAVLLDHVLEYEILDGDELALTLLRATGLISRSANPYREDPAGPEIAIPAGHCRGPWRIGFALYPYEGTWVEAGVLAEMERYQHPFLKTRGAGGAGVGDVEGAGLEVTGDGIVLSSLRRRDDWLELRLVCQQPGSSTATIASGFREARGADLLGRPGAPLDLDDGVLRLELGAWEIRTVQLRR